MRVPDWLDRLAAWLLALYPRGYRERFTAEWKETAAWRRSLATDETLSLARQALPLIVDTIRALPGAYLAVAYEEVRRMGSVREDLRHALRSLRRSPRFTAASVASLAVAIGANTAVFGVVHAVLLRPLPYPEPDRLVMVWNEFVTSGRTRLPLSGPGLEELRDQPGLFESIGGIWATSQPVATGTGEPFQASTGVVTPDFFRVLGVQPPVGRLHAREDGADVPLGVLLSDELWRSEFGADPGILGTMIRVGDTPRPVIGVLPSGFQLHFPPDGAVPTRLDLYTALPWDLRTLPAGQRFLRVVGRLRPGVALGAAQVAADEAGERARSAHAELTEQGDRFSVHPLQADGVRAARPILLALMVGVLLFLLLAAANVASLTLARMTARTRELALRASFGASPRRLVQLLVVEGGVLAAMGGVAGTLLGWAAAGVLWSLRPVGLMRAQSVTLDVPVIAFSVAVTALVALVFGLAPLAALSNRSPWRSLGSGARTLGSDSRRVREWVTVGEVAIGLVLLVGAGLLGQSLTRLASQDVGFDPVGLHSFKVALPGAALVPDAHRAELAGEIERAVSEIPGVESVGATSHLPFADWANWGGSAPPDGVPPSEANAYFADHRSVTPDYFAASGVRLSAGRPFTSSDDGAGAPVVILDRTFADRAFPGQDPVGRRLHPTRYVGGSFVSGPATVVGVIDDVRDVEPGRASTGQVYWPFAQSARWELTWVVRSPLPIDELAPSFRAAVRAADPGLAVAAIRTMDSLVADALAQARFVALLGGVFSGMALALAALGLYGVLAYLTEQRVPELGLRRLLGATAADVAGDVVRDGLRLGLAGVVIGGGGALLLTRFLRSLLFGVSPYDPRTLLAVAAGLVIVAGLASLVPARRALRVDPASALRPN